MNRVFILILFFVLYRGFVSGQGKTAPEVDVRVMAFREFEPWLNLKNDTLYLINFWASWCGPCKEELPDLLKLSEKYKGEKFRLVLVSLDFPSHIDSRLRSFILENRITEPIILLYDPDQNSWIDRVNAEWNGSLPYSVLYRKEFRLFFPDIIQFEAMDSIIGNKLGIT